MKPPKVKIDEVAVSESNYIAPDGWKYSALKLIEASKKYPVFDFPLAAVNLTISPFNLKDLDYFIFQMKRVEKTDLVHPIILDDRGQVADGWHRICKAILQGKRTIKAIRLEEMPEPDGKKENED